MRVTIAEDSMLLREGLARLLTDEGHEVVAAVGDADALLAMVAHDPPDVVIADVRMPPRHTDEGLRAAIEIRSRWPEVGVLVLSQYLERRLATELLATSTAGVGYLLKDRVTQIDDFLDALERVADGGSALDPDVVRRLLATHRNDDPLGKLTTRERDVLASMAEGHTNAAIAGRLYISQSAVEKHSNAIFDKLGLAGEGGYSRRVLAILRYLESL